MSNINIGIQNTHSGSHLRNEYIRRSAIFKNLTTNRVIKSQSRTTEISRPHTFEFTTNNFEKITDLKLELTIWCKDNELKGKRISDYRDVDTDAFGIPMPKYNAADRTVTKIEQSKTGDVKIEDGCEILNEKLDIDDTKLMRAIETFISTPFRKVTSNATVKEKYHRVARRSIFSFDQYDDEKKKFRILLAPFAPPKYRRNSNIHFKRHIQEKYATGKFKKTNQPYMTFGIPIDGSTTVMTSKDSAIENDVLPLDPDNVEKLIAEVLHYVSILPDKYNLYEKFVIFVLSVHEAFGKIEYLDKTTNKTAKYKYSKFKKYAAIFTYICAKIGPGGDPIVVFTEFLKQYLGDDYIFAPELFNTELSRNFMSLMAFYDATTESKLMFDINTKLSVLIAHTSSHKGLKSEPFVNSLTNSIDKISNLSYPSLDKTYRHYVGKHSNKRDEISINICNLIATISFQHSGNINVVLTNQQLTALFRFDFVKITKVSKVSDGTRIYCTARMGVTSDFRDDIDVPIFFDAGHFTATVKFKNQMLVKYGLNPVNIESQLSYKVYSGEHNSQCGDFVKNTINNTLEMYRVPIPHNYEVIIGPSITPLNILVPISLQGPAFGHSISMVQNRYRFKPGLDNLGLYNISIGESGDELSSDFRYDMSNQDIMSYNNKSNTIMLKNRELLFSGPYSKYIQNLNIRFKKTDASQTLKTIDTYKLSIVPVVEFTMQTQWSAAPPGRSFRHITVTNDGTLY